MQRNWISYTLLAGMCNVTAVMENSLEDWNKNEKYNDWVIQQWVLALDK